MTNAEINYIMDGVEETADNFRDWGKDYTYVPHFNEYTFKRCQPKEENKIVDWFNPGRWSNYPGASDQSGMHKRV